MDGMDGGAGMLDASITLSLLTQVQLTAAD